MMTTGKGRWLVMGLALHLAGCGGTTNTSERQSGNTNWLKECETDDDCGGLTCSCGTCRTDCGGAIECSLEPERACVGAANVAVDPAAPELLFEDRNPDAYAIDLAVDTDGSIVLAGGTDFYYFDLYPSYPTLWVGKLSAEGERLWEYREPFDAEVREGNTALSVALTGAGEVVTLSTIYDGIDTPELRRFDAQGDLLDTWTSAPGFTQLRSAPGGDLYAAGSDLLDTREGRPFTSAWMGRVAGDGMIWEQAREGLDGSISNATNAASNAAGELLVGGALGTATDSNASVPWLAHLDADGVFLWQASIATPRVSACGVTAVAFTMNGGALASASCLGPWLRAYDGNGELQWERRFSQQLGAVAGLSDGGYAVGLGNLERFAGAAGATLQRFSATHELLWQTTVEGCYGYERIVETPQGVLALAGCDTGYLLAQYADP